MIAQDWMAAQEIAFRKRWACLPGWMWFYPSPFQSDGFDWGLQRWAMLWTHGFRLPASGFRLLGWLHLGVNMAMLAVLGPVVARRAGPWRMLALYLAVMPLAALACAWVAGPEGSTAGASGAIHGLAGAVMLFAARDGHAGRAAGWVLAVALANAWFWWLTDGAFAWQVHLAGIGIGVGRAAVIRPPETKNAAPGGGVRSDTRQGWLRTPDPRICS